MSALQINKLSKDFKKKKVIKNFDFTVNEGEILV